MRPSNCKKKMYGCIFVSCKDKVCYKCNPFETIPFLCNTHKREVLKYYAKIRNTNQVIRKNKMCNFKQWRMFEKQFDIIRWPEFLMEYSSVLRKNPIHKFINNRYLHYFNFFIAVPESLKSKYRSVILEEEHISDSDEIDDNTEAICSIWNPYVNTIYPLHKDRDY